MEGTTAHPWPDDAPVSTSDAAVDRVLQQLPGLRDLPLAQQSAAYTDIHDRLLAELDAESE